ncbi:MAG: NAD(P)-dependent alcohol dehydrogenase [Bacteroidota bacterium]
MKAIIYHKYGSLGELKLQVKDKPQPEENEVLIKVLATSVNKADWFLLNGKPFPVRLMAGFFKPKNQILGADVSGVVEKVGGGVTQFKVGEEVFGDLSGSGFGGFAEYVTADEKLVAKKPSSLSFEETATLGMAAVTALQGLRDKGRIKRGHKVLINGASGGVGTFAVQIAKSFGAEVTAVCSTSKVEQSYYLGAEKVIDYKKENFTKSADQYDLILDVVGNESLTKLLKLLNPGGHYVSVPFSMSAMILAPWIAATQDKKVHSLLATPNQKDLEFLGDLAEKGDIKPVIYKTYTLDDVPEALQVMGSGHANGKIVITI